MAIDRSKVSAIGFIPLLVVTGIFGAYVFLATPSSPVYPTVASSTASGLQLRVVINSTNLLVGQNLSISVSLFNTLPTANNVSIDLKPIELNQAFFPIAIWGGCLMPEPMYFMIVKGTYSQGELEEMSVNSTLPLSYITCPEGGVADSLTFQPRSYVAIGAGLSCTAYCNPYQWSTVLASNFTVNGYWSLPLNDSEANDVLTYSAPCVITGIAGECLTYNNPEVGPRTQAPFSPGSYTLAVSDVLGQIDLLYFTVS